VKPQVATPPGWRIDYPEAVDAANTWWWDRFGDPVLSGLVDDALRANLDLTIAAARVDAFIGQLDRTRSQFYPQVNYNADASRNRASRVGTSPIPPEASPYYTLYQGALGASWQLDLFGRIRESERRRRASTRANRVGAASCCRSSRASRRATSRCAHSTASSRSRGRRRRITSIRK
jgi:multidrug efflux system outer membrane protein